MTRAPRTAAALLLLTGTLACAGFAPTGAGDPGFAFFVEPPEDDYWFDKVADWQRREVRDRPRTALADAATANAHPRSGQLRIKMARWETEERLTLARRVAEWAQAESRRHYRFDGPDEAVTDPWPTTLDLLDTNGDDCDGLDLIAYELMREFGFPEDRTFRSIVSRNRDGANHMVTLWFADDSGDPWVIDATGAVTLRVRRFSQLPGWTPTKVFNASVQFTPRGR